MTEIKTLGHLHKANQTNKYEWEPQRTNHFEVTINGLLDDEGDATHKFALAVSTFSLPNITTDPIEIAHGNSRQKYAGQAVFGGAESLEVIDYIYPDMEMIVRNWQVKVYNPQTDMMGLAADYKKDAIVTEYSPDGIKLRQWKLEGVWPSGVAYGDTLTQDGSEVKKVTLTLAYDRGWRVASSNSSITGEAVGAPATTEETILPPK
jgi:hypothetical protein